MSDVQTCWPSSHHHQGFLPCAGAFFMTPVQEAAINLSFLLSFDGLQHVLELFSVDSVSFGWFTRVTSKSALLRVSGRLWAAFF